MNEEGAASRTVLATDLAQRYQFYVIPLQYPVHRNGRVVCSCGKADCPNPAKHPLTPHGWKDATVQPERIAALWKRHPQANIGIATEPSHLVILDIDERHGGFDTLAELQTTLGRLPDTITCLTGGGGEHRYFRAPPGPAVRSTAGVLGPGVDVRAAGGLVVAPGSAHSSGRPYRWEALSSPDDVALADLPHAWAERLVPQQRPPPDDTATDRPIRDGQRNDTLMRIAGAMRRQGCGEEEIADALLAVNARCTPPLDHEEVRRIAHSAGRYAPAGQGADAEPGQDPPPIPVPSFPTDVLPGAAGELVREGAAALGCPPEFIALPLLACAGATMGSRWCLRLKPEWVEYPTLFVVCVGPPGSTKTPALKLARAPLDVLQREARDQFKADLGAYERDLDDWNRAKRKGDGAATSPKPEQPSMAHFFTTDATMEAMAAMLESSAGFALIRDEAIAWVRSFDAYRGGKGGDRANWLSLWSAMTLKVDRKTAPPIVVDTPVVCVAGGTQPEMLPMLADEAARLDGFIERLLWAYPAPTPALWSEATVRAATHARLLEDFRALRRTTAEVDLDSAARARWITWFVPTLNQAAREQGLMAGTLAKLPNQVARLALVLHALTETERGQARPLSLETMQRAIRLGEYFVAHARRVTPAFSRHGGLEHALLLRVLRILQEAGEWADKRTLYKRLGGAVRAADLDAVLLQLAEASLAESRTVEHDGPGRPSSEWRTAAPREQMSK